MADESVPTPVGAALISWFRPAEAARVVMVLGHGTATGVEAGDLQAIAATLPSAGVAVALVTQPYRLNRGRGRDEPSLDLAWKSVWPRAAESGVPIIAGGRSAGSQVACRTAKDLGAVAVLALAYPLLGPGSPRELLATGLPTLIVQGTNDPFGQPAQFPQLPPSFEMVEVPLGNHMFGVPAGAATDAPPPLAIVASAVSRWVETLLLSL